MTEGWAIAMLSGALVVMTGVLGWVAAEIRLLHKSLTQYVLKADCMGNMLAHAARIEKMEGRVSENSEKLAAIEQYHKMIHVPIIKRPPI